jgi:hypothetical protein
VAREVDRIRPPQINNPDVADLEAGATHNARIVMPPLSTVLDSLGTLVKVVDRITAGAFHQWHLYTIMTGCFELDSSIRKGGLGHIDPGL